MTIVLPDAHPLPRRASRPRHYLLCPPTHFAVDYQINPWMQPALGADRALAMAQWEQVWQRYASLGHHLEQITPAAGLPDLVFAANAGVVIGDKALVSRFRHPERTGEEAVFLDWFRQHGYDAVQAGVCNEGEGDYLVTARGILAGSGFRTDPAAHAEVASFFGRPVLPLTLVDPRFYHLDTALAVLDDETIAYFPAAFAPASRDLLAREFPDAILATEADAVAFGLNACSDGRHVLLAAGAVGLAEQLTTRGFEPMLVDTSELQKAGGSVKCCTLELHA